MPCKPCAASVNFVGRPSAAPLGLYSNARGLGRELLRDSSVTSATTVIMRHPYVPRGNPEGCPWRRFPGGSADRPVMPVTVDLEHAVPGFEGLIPPTGRQRMIKKA